MARHLVPVAKPASRGLWTGDRLERLGLVELPDFLEVMAARRYSKRPCPAGDALAWQNPLILLNTTCPSLPLNRQYSRTLCGESARV